MGVSSACQTNRASADRDGRHRLDQSASGWEVAIKQRLGKLSLADSFRFIVEDSDFDELAVTLRHAEQVTALPPHHADPSDRMLVAQVRVEGATVLTHDPR